MPIGAKYQVEVLTLPQSLQATVIVLMVRDLALVVNEADADSLDEHALIRALRAVADQFAAGSPSRAPS
jgi:hypothetical protein